MNKRSIKELNIAYKMLAEAYLFGKYAVDRLDQRFAEYRPAFIPAPWREELKDAPHALTYISLLNNAHTEWLSEEDTELLEKILSGHKNYEETKSFLERTYPLILRGDQNGDLDVEYYPDVHGRGIFPADAIIFMFSDIPEYDEQGNRDIEREEEKNRTFANVKAQYEKIVNEGSEDKIILIRY